VWEVAPHAENGKRSSWVVVIRAYVIKFRGVALIAREMIGSTCLSVGLDYGVM
jgi:hypothetical protein